MMRALIPQWSAFLDTQHREPRALFGRLIGERMLRQHRPETDWSIKLLRLQVTDRVLEVGFGAGRGLTLVTQAVPHGSVIGIDRSPTMVRAARRQNRRPYQAGHLSLLQADIAALPIVTPCFDKIFSVHTFYVWPDPLVRCQALIRILAPGGRMVITFATAETLASGERTFWPIQQQAEAVVHDLAPAEGCTATLACGPDSRQYNNVALIIDKLTPNLDSVSDPGAGLVSNV